MNSLKKTILHVDDDADDRDLLREVIHRVAPHLNIIFAENGLHALEVLNISREAEDLPSLIVLDLNMPFLNGKQTFERIKADPQLKNIPLVVFSSGESPHEKSFFHDEGIAYFTKPFEFAALKAIGVQLANLCC